MDSRSAKHILWKKSVHQLMGCGGVHTSDKEKSYSACNEPNYPNSFAEEVVFFFFFLFPVFSQLE